MTAVIVPFVHKDKVGFFPLSGSIMTTDIFLYAFVVFCQSRKLKLEEFPVELESGFKENVHWLKTRRDELQWLFTHDTMEQYPFGTQPPYMGAQMNQEIKQLFLVQTGTFLRGVHETISVLGSGVEHYLAHIEHPNIDNRKDLMLNQKGTVDWIEARMAIRPFFYETFEPDGPPMANTFFEAFVNRAIERIKGEAEAQSPLSPITLSLVWGFQYPNVKHIANANKLWK